MEKSLLLLFVTFFCFLVSCNGIETPQFTVVHSESDFEVRFYRESSWMSAPTREISFQKATKDGFHRLFQYIQGANLNSSRLRMTTPVLTSIVPGAGPLGSSAYFVQFYLPAKFQAVPPLPLPELNLQPDAWDGHCIAVRKFSGFVRDSNVVEEAEKLALSLSRSPWADSTSADDKYAYSIAQYNHFRVTERKNEVWVKVHGSELSGCRSSGVATH
ncbi:heme-binding protein 2-like [Macadamia integrifolia]|uniref:heme-binding protein 2-like n=1 Tax=Macadamia integrifolia TaxID=60698 RepID=UPI001C4E4D05|nr:heme-binding protein 2-like [Macadamia integrifolia]